MRINEIASLYLDDAIVNESPFCLTAVNARRSPRNFEALDKFENWILEE